jgi:hypothetical protein
MDQARPERQVPGWQERRHALQGCAEGERTLNTLLVGYDLNRPGQDYEELFEFLKSRGTWCHPLDSTWLVVSPLASAQFRDEVKRHIDANDEVLVVNVTGDNWAAFGFTQKVNDWLQKHI